MTARDHILQEHGTHPGIEVDHIEQHQGIRIYLKGHPYPVLGLPTPEALFAINAVKRLALEGTKALGPLILLRRKPLLSAFSRVATRILDPYRIPYENLTPQAQELTDLIAPLDHDLATILATIIDYDAAYRMRLSDLLAETTVEKLMSRPRSELKRLICLNTERDYDYQSAKIRLIGKISTYALLIPSIRRTFKETLSRANFSKLQWNPADLYWAHHKTDYNYFGQSYEERQKLL